MSEAGDNAFTRNTFLICGCDFGSAASQKTVANSGGPFWNEPNVRMSDTIRYDETEIHSRTRQRKLFDAQQVGRRHLILSDVDPFARRQWFEMLRIVSGIVYQVTFARDEKDAALLFPTDFSYRRYRLGVADLL